MEFEKKNLKDYTDEEIYKVLERNNIADLTYLIGISSEGLRRLIDRVDKLTFLASE